MQRSIEEYSKPLARRDHSVTKRNRLWQWLGAVFGRTNRRESVSLLLVDDDEDVRALLRGRLESAGYRVAEAPNGEVALQMYRRDPTEAVLTDIVMPEMDGRELISALRDSFPDARIVAISGAIDRDVDGLLRDGRRLGALQSLQKPFTSQQMLHAVQKVLA